MGIVNATTVLSVVPCLSFQIFICLPAMCALQSQGYISIICAVVAGWSSLAARRAHNPKVVGSNPAPATRFIQASSKKVMLSIFGL